MPSSSEKIKTASSAQNQKIADLLTLAAGAPSLTFAQDKSVARLYELVVLAEIIKAYISHTKGTATVVSATPGVLRFAGRPCKADKGVYSYIRLEKDGVIEHEAWVSVEVTTLSWDRAGSPTPEPASSRHEIDVALFSPLPSFPCHPNYHDLHAGFSCKHRPANKESVREALGLRRETALLIKWPGRPRIGWHSGLIPTAPASPLYLASSCPGVVTYQDPLKTLGLYMRHIPFPP